MGEVFAGRYELLDPIAEGGMGSVWRVHDRRDDEVRAAKLLRQRDASSLLRFMREQSTRIHHPHVVTPQSWAGEDDTVLFTMPLVRGGSVATLVGDYGPLSPMWVTVVLDQTLAALEAVHAAGVVHRDVKPANLLLEPTGTGLPHTRLTDFGIAAPLNEPRLTTASTALGTPGYMAPEQRRGADPDVRQDLYAVAMVGMEMLTGDRPPYGEDRRPRGPLADVLSRAMDPDPLRRPESAAQMRAELRSVVPPGLHWEAGEVEVLDHFAPENREVATLSVEQPVERPVSPPVDVATDNSAPEQEPLFAVPAGRSDAEPVAPAPGERRSPAGLAAGLAVLGVLLLVLALWLWMQ